jgi:hypothetical protein
MRLTASMRAQLITAIDRQPQHDGAGVAMTARRFGLQIPATVTLWASTAANESNPSAASTPAWLG